MRQGRGVYIWPTVSGWWWMGAIILLLLMGWGYTNNLCLALSVLLFSLTVVLLLECHFNLAGLRIQRVKIEDQFAKLGANAQVFYTSKKMKERWGLELYWPGVSQPCEFEAQGHGSSKGEFRFPKRGRLTTDYMRLESRYPLGLFKSWSYHHFNAEAIAYPPPVKGQRPIDFWPRDAMDAEKLHAQGQNADEPGELVRYSHGDPLSRIAWKVKARGLPLYSKTFEGVHDTSVVYHWPWGDRSEEALGQLSGVIEGHSLRGEDWELVVNGDRVLKDVQYRQTCLKTLAQVVI